MGIGICHAICLHARAHSIAPRIPEINRLRAMRTMRIKPDTFSLAVPDPTFEPGTLNSETLLFYVLDLFPNLFQF